MTQHKSQNLKVLTQKEIQSIFGRKTKEFMEFVHDINKYTEFKAFGLLAVGVEDNNEVSACVGLKGTSDEISTLISNLGELKKICLDASMKICMEEISKNMDLDDLLKGTKDDE
ncbi:DUF2482 family protein [Staphylococcus lentus]|uniref:DUF2482 family protein n=1 Tax=Mammaliicoccus lentus TaxID=42858 RepID=UPI00188315FA|nr:DUF2482 family protein [Mammaliicoccus lentus]MBF0842337.1 DUF2482 family protein [Mammaliicoccus lentus]